jgi:hypothetical protein
MKHLTVADLIEELKKLPPDAKVYREGGEYKDDYREVVTAYFEKHLGWGLQGVIIK